MMYFLAYSAHSAWLFRNWLSSILFCFTIVIWLWQDRSPEDESGLGSNSKYPKSGSVYESAPMPRAQVAAR